MLNLLLHGLRNRPSVDQAIGDASPRTILALGLLSGLAPAVGLWIFVLIASALIGFGSGTPSGNFRAVLIATWTLVPVLTITGGVAGISRRHFLGLHPGWGRIGAALAALAGLLLLNMTWAYRQRLIQGDALTRESVYDVPGSLYLATETDGLLFVWFGFAALAGAIVFTLVAGSLLDTLVVRLLGVTQSVGHEPAPSASDFQREQTGLSRLKLEIAGLRGLATEHRQIDPIIGATDVIDRETGRAVPRWMEPVAALNFRLGKGLVIGFVVSALIWFGAVALKAPEEWLVWRNAFFVTPSAGSFIVQVDLVPNISAIRINAVSGEGDALARLARRGVARALPGRVVRVRGYPENPRFRAPPNIIAFDGLEPGPYALHVDWLSGSLFVGITAERNSSLSTHFLAAVLGVGAAGMLAAGAGLLLLAAANIRAYLNL